MIIKTVRVSEKGQIAIPRDVREMIGIKKGDDMLLIQDQGKILLEKTPEKLKDDFKDLLKHSETVAKKLWGNKKDDIWDKL
ncbi:MAG: AbrB/MazE/SpoVT family DNA-binding domain-containing protein [archaeon]